MNYVPESISPSKRDILDGIATQIDAYLSNNAQVARQKLYKDRPLVSVLLPVFNGAPYVEKSLLSLLNQTYDNVEIIVIDDGSSDGTAGIVRGMQSDFPKIQYHRQDNAGIVDALNNALDLATGTFLARQDADDISRRTRLETQLSYLYSNPHCLAVSGGFLDMDASGVPTGGRCTPRNPKDADYLACPAYEPYLPHPFLLMRGEPLRKLRYRYVFHAEDADLYWRAQTLGTLSNLEEPLGFYRIHKNSISGRSAREGRIQAVFSQLAAISAARVDMLGSDLRFEKPMLELCREANELRHMIECVSGQLSQRERDFLATASALKLLECTSYRPYKLETSDIKFIRSAVNIASIRHQGSRRYAKTLMRRFYRDHIAGGLARFYFIRLANKIRRSRARC